MGAAHCEYAEYARGRGTLAQPHALPERLYLARRAAWRVPCVRWRAVYAVARGFGAGLRHADVVEHVEQAGLLRNLARRGERLGERRWDRLHSATLHVAC